MSELKSQYGIIGNPLEHSLSPVMHNAAFKKLGVDAVYKIFPLDEDELEVFFEELKDEDSLIFGLNVTVPYKERAVRFMDKLSPLAEKISAVNTVVINEKRELMGYNTDAPGFMAHLEELGVQTKGKNIAMLGAGGSARAILATLCLLPKRPKEISIYNRSAKRLDALLTEIGSKVDISIVQSVPSVEDLDLRACDLLINTTSIGMHEDDPCLVDAAALHPDLFVYDLIYSPSETLLLKMAKEADAQTSNGLGMLFYQGVLALQHWADTEIDEKVKMAMRNALKEAVGV